MIAPFRVIQECSSIESGLQLMKLEKQPFIVRNLYKKDQISNIATSNIATSNIDLSALREIFIKDENILSWYETPTELFNETRNSGATLIDDWDKDQLKYNIVDSPNEHYELLPEPLKTNMHNLDQIAKQYAICYSLTKRNNLTKYHVDPLGDGWVHLKCGKKIWHIISDDDVKYLESKGISLFSIKDMNFTELVHLLDCYLWNKIYITDMTADDFIYFPQNWAHRVLTYDKSFGICGYTINL